MEKEPWYGVRCYFRHEDSADRHGPALYEERIILVHASSFDEAIAKAESEAKTYASDLGSVAYLNAADAFHIAAETIQDGTEVYSLLRESDMGAQDYIKTFFQTGSERSH